MPWYLCNMGHKHRTQDAATNCHYCRTKHCNWLERIAKQRRDWEQKKKQIAKEKKITKAKFMKLTERQKWEVVPLLTKVNWCCVRCDAIIDGGKRPRREIFPRVERRCCNCNGLLTRRTGGGQNDPFGYYPAVKK